MTLRIGRPEQAFILSLTAYLLTNWFAPASGWSSLFMLLVLGLGAWVSIRVSAQWVKGSLWRLRNRLIAAYFFIAVVPIVLLTALFGVGVYLVSGQVCLFLITSEMDRRAGQLRGSMDFVMRDLGEGSDPAAGVGRFIRSRYPGVEIAVVGDRKWVYPDGSKLTPPRGDLSDARGLVVKDKKLYGWAHVKKGNVSATALFPMTRAYLGEMAPDIAESNIFGRVDEDVNLLHEELAAGATRNRLPPAVNGLDFEVWWWDRVPITVWEQPGKAEWLLLSVRTRPSALMRAISLSKAEISNETLVNIFITVAILFLIAELIALVVGISITRRITGAIHDLYVGTMRVMKGDFSHRIPIRGNDQVCELAASFNQMTGNVQRLVDVEKEQERLHSELEIAIEVQSQLHPKEIPDLKTLRLTAICNAARMVSGDYYDYQQLDEKRVAIAIGDVAGKGISAALLMATLQSSFRAQLRTSLEVAAGVGHDVARVSVSTSRLVSRLNQQLHASSSPEKYATFFFGMYDEASGSLTYTNAGHLPPILVRNGEASRLEVNGMVVGAFPFAQYDESRIEMLPGDLLVLFTDGVTEPENEYGEMYGEDRLTEFVSRNQALDDAEIVRCLLEAVEEWTGGGELQDDITLLLVRRR